MILIDKVGNFYELFLSVVFLVLDVSVIVKQQASTLMIIARVF